ncbi:MAG: hypothetical protein Q4A15_01230 [Prevotellaceae bacterium]|nr:hypothetical protein [Prevotellaceae bacterium]
MAKLKREAHALYIKPVGLSTNWFLIGKGIDSLSIEMNGSFEQTKDITGSVTVSDTGYTPQISVEPYQANPDDSIYAFLKDLAMNRKSGDDAKVEILEVLIEDTEDESHDAWKENGRVEITNYGGDTSAMAINFNLWYDGDRKQGTATITEGVPSFS